LNNKRETEIGQRAIQFKIVGHVAFHFQTETLFSRILRLFSVAHLVLVHTIVAMQGKL